MVTAPPSSCPGLRPRGRSPGAGGGGTAPRAPLGNPRTVGRALRAHAAAVGGRRGLDSLVEATALQDGASAPVERIETLIDLGRARVAAGLGRRGRGDLRAAAAEAGRLLFPEPDAGDAPYGLLGEGRDPWVGDGRLGVGPYPASTGRLLRATRAANAWVTGAGRRPFAGRVRRIRHLP